MDIGGYFVFLFLKQKKSYFFKKLINLYIKGLQDKVTQRVHCKKLPCKTSIKLIGFKLVTELIVFAII